MATQEELIRLKAARKAAQTAAAPGAIWHLIEWDTCQQAVDFANVYPPQGAGEFGMTDNAAGKVCGYYFF